MLTFAPQQRLTRPSLGDERWSRRLPMQQSSSTSRDDKVDTWRGGSRRQISGPMVC
jgi:hypothetical protein